MSMKTNKLRKAIVVLVVAALILLPNLIAFADETEGPQGTPVPEVTADNGGDDQSGDDQSGDDQSGDDQSGDDQSGEDQSGDDQSGDDQSGDDQSGDDQSGEDQPDDDQSGDDQSGDDQSGDDQSGDDQSGDDQSGDDQSGDDQSGDDQSGDDQSGDDQSGDDQSGDDQSGDDQSGDDQSGDDQSGDDQSGDDQSGDDQSGDDQSGDDQSGDDQSGDDQSGDDRSGDDQSGNDQSGDDGSGDDQSGDDQSGGDQSGDDQSGDDQSGDDQSGDDQSGDDGEDETPPAPPAAAMGVDGAPQPEADTVEADSLVWFHNTEGLASYSVKVQEQEYKRFGFMDWRWVDKGSPYYLSVTFGSGDMVTSRSLPYHSIVTVTANNKTNPTYTFKGWTSATSGTKTGNTTEFTVNLSNLQGVHAEFNPPPSYTINFYDYNSTLLSSQSVMEGMDAVPPTNLDKQDREFTGWDSDDWKDVDGPANITAQYALKPILKFHYVEGLTGYSCTANGSSISVPTPTPSSTVKTVYAPIGSTIVIGATVAGTHSLDGFESAPFSGQGVAPAESGVTYEFKAMTTRTHYALQLVKGNDDIANFSVTAGSASGNYGSQTIYIPIDTDVTVTANPAGGKVFDYWESNYDAPPLGARNGNYWPFTMNADYKVVAYGEDIDNLEPFNGKFRITHQGFGGSSSGSVKVYYNGNTYGPLSVGQFVDIQYVDGQNTVKVQALPNATPPTMFIQWANHGGVTTEYMDINLTTGQGSAGSAPNSLECILGEIEIIVKPQFEQVGSLTITKKDIDTELTISGATFQLKNSSGSVMPGNVNGGVYTWGNLLQGTYELKEVSPPAGYEAPSPNTWTVRIGINGGIDGLECTNTNWNPTGTVYNKCLYGSISLQKALNGTHDLSGFEFTLTTEGGDTVSTQTTGTSGKLTWDSLPPGTYYINETARDGFYLPATQSNNVEVIVSAGSESSVTFTNCEYGSISLQKVLNGTHDLSGFEFTLKDEGGATVGTKTTDATGKLTWDNLEPGKYYLSETARDGFYLPATQSNNVEVVVTYGNESVETFTNCEYASIKVVKTENDGQTPFAGVAFTLKQGDTVVDSGTTDANGEILWPDLEPGDYTVVETVPDGYYVLPGEASHSVKLTYGQDEVINVTNYEYVEIYAKKVDIITGAPLAGAEFSIYTGSSPGGSFIATRTTGADGIALFGKDLMLKAGEAYWIKETSPPPGYQNDPATAYGYSVTIETYGGNNAENPVMFKNTPDPGDFAFEKRDTNNPSILLGRAVYHLSGMHWNGSSLVPITYELTTNASGYASVTGLTPGTYILQEVTAPFGYAIDPNPHTVIIYSGRTTRGEDVEQVSNEELEHGSIVIIKYATGSTYRLQGAEFSLFKKYYDDTLELVSTLTTDVSGNIAWNNLQAGTYVIVENSAPAGYTIVSQSTNVTLNPGARAEVVIYNNGPTPTTTTPVNPPETTITPSPSPTPSPTPTPVPTATPTPINTDEVEIADVDPAFGPETGEGDGLFMTIGILLLMAATLFVIRKKAVLKR